MDKALPPVLRHLGEELGYQVRRKKPALGYELFSIDLSSWKLRLSNRTPVIWAQKADLEECGPMHLAQSLMDVVRERSLDRQITLVLLDGEGQPLRHYLSGPLHSFVVLGAAEQEQVLQSRWPSGELLDLISAQVPISALAPYETRAPVTGSRFFGREYEVSRILGNPDTNHAILGIRRVGKTSLLREVERIFREQEDDVSAVYLDCSDLLTAEDYIREVVRKLNPPELPRLHLQQYVFFFPDFLERMARAQKRKITFFLDEIDNLVIMQRGNWELFRMLRASSNKGACQYIIAGFREAMREQYLLDSPFYNFAQEIRLNEFTRRQACDLIVTPIENLRVRFKHKDEVVGRIYEETAGHPNLLRGLSAAFGIVEAQVWYASVHELSLRLVAQIGTTGTPVSVRGGAARPGLQSDVPIGEDRLEARAYREATSLRGPESGQSVKRALPLLTPGRRPIGVVAIQDSLGDNRFVAQRERELQLAGYLNQAARALEQVGKRTQELALAGRVQASLLPRAPSLPGWQLAAVLRPARQMAGDFFDFIPLPAGRLGIVVADVTDKGMGAALYMALSRTLVRTYAADYPSQPELVLRATSARMLSDAGAGLFVTVFYGVLDPTQGRLVYCNAGHHPPYLISAPVPPAPPMRPVPPVPSEAEGTTEGRADGETGSAELAEAGITLRPLGRTGMALGVVDEATWQQDTVQIAPGDLLLLYTDGVVEAQNREKEFFGSERMLEVAQQQAGRSAQETQEALMAALREFAGNEAQSDDIALVVVKREPEGLEREKAEPSLHVVESHHGRRHGAAIV